MTDTLIEAVARAIFFTPNTAERGQDELERMFVEWKDEREKVNAQAQAAIASVIAHATSAEAVERALEMHHDLTHPDTGWTRQDAMKATIIAALTGGQ